MKPINSEIREQIRLRIKNRLDISDLIKDISLQGEDLSFAIIKTFNRCEEDLSNTNFSKAIIGEEGKVTVFSSNKIDNCLFVGVRFLGRTLFRHCKGIRVNFADADLGKCEFQHSTLLNCRWCGAIVKVGSLEWLGAVVDEAIFQDWAKGLNVKINVTKK